MNEAGTCDMEDWQPLQAWHRDIGEWTTFEIYSRNMSIVYWNTVEVRQVAVRILSRIDVFTAREW